MIWLGSQQQQQPQPASLQPQPVQLQRYSGPDLVAPTEHGRPGPGLG